MHRQGESGQEQYKYRLGHSKISVKNQRQKSASKIKFTKQGQKECPKLTVKKQAQNQRQKAGQKLTIKNSGSISSSRIIMSSKRY
jgi:hypothetical protein